MIGELHDATTADQSYRTAQTNLLNCLSTDTSTRAVKPFSFSSFDAMLDNYTTDVRAKIAQDCSSQESAMFSTMQSVSRTELAELKRNDADYRALLETAYGQAFEDDVGNPDFIKLYATLMAHEVSGASSSTSNALAPINPTPVPLGVNCLPPGATASTLEEKVDALNCLVVDTPLQFWVTQSAKTKEGNDLAGASDNRYDFLGYGDWRCSIVYILGLEPPFVPGCLRHDVAYSSLQEFAGTQTNTALDDFERDSTWHPRNKYLADLILKADFMRLAENWDDAPLENCDFINDVYLGYEDTALAYYACQIILAADGAIERAGLFNWGIRTFWNTFGWKPTPEEIADVRQNPYFIIDPTQD